MRYSIDQIEAFALAARERSFSTAAKILGKSQSTVSLAIGNLETDLGVKLFDRSTKYPGLTEEGKALLREAESVLLHYRAFEESSLNLFRKVEPKLRLCLDESLPSDMLAAALRQLSEKFPHLDVIEVPPGFEGVAHRVASGEADVGVTVVNYHYPQEIAFTRLGQMILVNAVSAGHPMARLETVRFSHLNAVRQIAYAPNEHRVPTNQHLDSSSVWSLHSYTHIIELVRQGLGWAVLPRHLAEPLLESGELVKLELESYQDTRWHMNIDAIWPTGRRLGAAAYWFKEHIGKAAAASEHIAR